MSSGVDAHAPAGAPFSGRKGRAPESEGGVGDKVPSPVLREKEEMRVLVLRDVEGRFCRSPSEVRGKPRKAVAVGTDRCRRPRRLRQ